LSLHQPPPYEPPEGVQLNRLRSDRYTIETGRLLLSHQVWNSYDEILTACRNAWNKFMQMPKQIASITQRDWIKAVTG
ncbi:MAG: hypothetical protein B7Z58_18410, partial [Acidiphilium sp. 37-64-53]